jgi:hypothetical protein
MIESFGARVMDLLKAHPWQMAMIAVALAVVLCLVSKGTIPYPGDGWMSLIWVTMLLTFGLALAPVGSSLQAHVHRSLQKREWRQHQQEAEQEFRDYIEHLTDNERQILGYLLAKNQKTFDVADDGGYAASLIARGFVVHLGVRGQILNAHRVPVGVREDVWRVIKEQPDKFPYTPHYSSGPGRKVETHPWRVPWGA